MNYINSKEHKEWSRKVRERDGCCMICKTTTKRLNAHHLIPKNFLNYRSDVTNGFTLCYGCHTGGRFSAHKNPIWFVKWLSKNYPEVYWLALDRTRVIDDDL